tara:strand:+ start:405 stop:1073 length:669 start_codon:yes stop_codon:yes gene_type:complete
MKYQNLTKPTPYLYYFCTIQNISSILDFGILSRNKAIELGVFKEDNDWSNRQIQFYRKNTSIVLSSGKKSSGHDLVCTFFSPYNTTIYKAQEILNIKGGEYSESSLVIAINIKKLLTNMDKAFAFSDRNVGAKDENVNYYNSLSDIDKLDWSVINQTYKKFDDYTDPTFREWRNKKSAEFLIENIVEPKYFSQLLCISEDTKAFLQKNTQISVEVRKNLALY